jgi:hypothetical protein
VIASEASEPGITPQMLEDLAMGLRGIFTCRVTWEAGAAAPAQVRVVCDADRSTAAPHDIATAWVAAFGVQVPRDRFTVTPVRSPSDVKQRTHRFQLSEFGYGHTGNAIEARVSLFLNGETIVGSAVAEGEVEWLRLAADATLAAVAQAVPEAPLFSLEDIQETTVGGRPCVVCVVAARERGKGLPYLGACFVRQDRREAAVRAVLDAVNRQLSRYI